MLPKFGIVFIWFNLAFLLVFVNISYLMRTSIKPSVEDNYISIVPKPVNIQSSQSQGLGKLVNFDVFADDGRIHLLDKFLTGSPLAPYSSLMVSLADEYSLDYRLLPAIAMCESNLGKRIPTHDSYNAWGIAVYTGQQTGATFKDWPTAIRWVYAYIADKYVTNNITGVIDVGAIWAPPSVEKGNSWANCVQTFMSTIEQ